MLFYARALHFPFPRRQIDHAAYATWQGGGAANNGLLALVDVPSMDNLQDPAKDSEFTSMYVAALLCSFFIVAKWLRTGYAGIRGGYVTRAL